MNRMDSRDRAETERFQTGCRHSCRSSCRLVFPPLMSLWTQYVQTHHVPLDPVPRSASPKPRQQFSSFCELSFPFPAPPCPTIRTKPSPSSFPTSPQRALRPPARSCEEAQVTPYRSLQGPAAGLLDPLLPSSEVLMARNISQREFYLQRARYVSALGQLLCFI